MRLISSNSELSKNGLTVSIKNASGLPVNISGITYSIVSIANAPVSGANLPAISQGNGIYYASWSPQVPNGSYKIIWSIPGGLPIEKLFFVVDKSAYPCTKSSPYGVKPNAIPPYGSKTYLANYQLTPSDLRVLFTNSSTNLPVDPYEVFWTILDKNNCTFISRTTASKNGVGDYWVNWLVRGRSGDYKVIFEYTEYAGAPINTVLSEFSIICPKTPEPENKPCGCKPVISCNC
jgi:hypothetical protein